jgi:glycosyltransferase involved in cell wall biosynthesis
MIPFTRASPVFRTSALAGGRGIFHRTAQRKLDRPGAARHSGQVPPLAIITMVYNERERLPYWLSHYARQVGLEHCYVVDHGSDDGSTDDLRGANRIRLPRSPQDNERRLKFVAAQAQGLLQYYRRIAYVDADELLLADPAAFADLSDYASRMGAHAMTSIGLEIVQGADEAPLEPGRGIGEQRASAIFSSSMCKTNMIRKPVSWAPGWHSHNGQPNFDRLYLFHLRHADLGHALTRLAVTRGMPWVSDQAGKHQRVDDDWMRSLMDVFGNRPLAQGTTIADPDGPLAADLKAFVADSTPHSDKRRPWQVPLARYGAQRIPLGDAFRAALSEKPI